MPVLDGFGATREIREFEKKNSLPNIPIFAMTAGTDEAWRKRSEKMGLNGIIPKPVNIKQIEEVIQPFIHVDKDQSLPEKWLFR